MTKTWDPTPWTLRPYQVEALRAISNAWSEGHIRTLLVLATGLGKTLVFAEVARRMRQQGRKPILVIAHRIELVDQAAKHLRAAGLEVAVESGERRAMPWSALDEDAVVATVQTLKGKRLEKWPADYFAAVVVDEAHHAAAASYRAVIDRFVTAKHLGVTATPDRGDSVAIGHVYPHLAYEYGIREGIEAGYLSPIRSIAIEAASIDLSTIRTTTQAHGRDYSAEDLSAQMESDACLHELAGPIAREAKGRQTLVFVPSVAIAHALSVVLSGYMGPQKVSSLDGTSDKITREQTLDRYQSGELQCLVNCALFTEGFDAPATSCVVIARPTKSRPLYAQMVGRGTRICEGKRDLLVLNTVPTNADHKLIGPLDLFAGLELPEDARREAAAALEAGGALLTAIGDAEEREREREASRQRERDRAKIVAEVQYRKWAVDPFEELGIDTPSERDMGGPRATERMAAALDRAGFKGASNLSRRAASKLLDELKGRRRKGLCTVKQARVLARSGLRPDLTFEEAREAMDALVANKWRVTPDVAARWGQ